MPELDASTLNEGLDEIQQRVFKRYPPECHADAALMLHLKGIFLKHNVEPRAQIEIVIAVAARFPAATREASVDCASAMQLEMLKFMSDVEDAEQRAMVILKGLKNVPH